MELSWSKGTNPFIQEFGKYIFKPGSSLEIILPGPRLPYYYN